MELCAMSERRIKTVADMTPRDIADLLIRYAEQEERIAALEAEAKMLRFSLAAHPDRQTSTGAAQAAMTYEIELRDRRIAALQADNEWQCERNRNNIAGYETFNRDLATRMKIAVGSNPRSELAKLVWDWAQALDPDQEQTDE